MATKKTAAKNGTDKDTRYSPGRETLPDGVYAIIDRGPGKRIEIYHNQYNGHDLIHMREHYQPDGTDEWRPTKKGITFSEQDQVDAAIVALTAAREDV